MRSNPLSRAYNITQEICHFWRHNNLKCNKQPIHIYFSNNYRFSRILQINNLRSTLWITEKNSRMETITNIYPRNMRCNGLFYLCFPPRGKLGWPDTHLIYKRHRIYSQYNNQRFTIVRPLLQKILAIQVTERGQIGKSTYPAKC